MAYSTSNPPTMMTDRIGGGAALWHYFSTDAHGTVSGAGYFTNGSALGMQAGDALIAVDTDTSYNGSMHIVTSVTAGGAATVSARITA